MGDISNEKYKEIINILREKIKGGADPDILKPFFNMVEIKKLYKSSDYIDKDDIKEEYENTSQFSNSELYFIKKEIIFYYKAVTAGRPK